MRLGVEWRTLASMRELIANRKGKRGVRSSSCVAGLLLFSVFAAHGCGGRVDFGPAATGSGGVAGAAVTAAGGRTYRVEGACAHFGLQFSPGCDDCPSEPLTCPCADAVKATVPYERCVWGKCLRQLDCKDACDINLRALLHV